MGTVPVIKCVGMGWRWRKILWGGVAMGTGLTLTTVSLFNDDVGDIAHSTN